MFLNEKHMTNFGRKLNMHMAEAILQDSHEIICHSFDANNRKELKS